MIGETGIWSEEEAQHHQHSEALAKFFAGYFEWDKRVYDFGCGLGFYVKRLRDAGFKAYGFEGKPLIKALAKDHTIICDLTNPFEVDGGNVICLEVGEHIPKEFEQVILNNICLACDGKLVLSWALPNQPGLGHVNCQPQDYIIAEVCRRGFVYKEELTKEVRGTIEAHCDWFQRTLLIFERV